MVFFRSWNYVFFSAEVRGSSHPGDVFFSGLVMGVRLIDQRFFRELP